MYHQQFIKITITSRVKDNISGRCLSMLFIIVRFCFALFFFVIFFFLVLFFYFRKHSKSLQARRQQAATISLPFSFWTLGFIILAVVHFVSYLFCSSSSNAGYYSHHNHQHQLYHLHSLSSGGYQLWTLFGALERKTTVTGDALDQRRHHQHARISKEQRSDFYMRVNYCYH